MAAPGSSTAHARLPFDEMQHREMSRVFRFVSTGRVVGAVLVSVTMMSLVLYEGTPWRIGLTALATAMILVVSVVELVRFRRTGLGTWSFPVNLWLMAVAHGAMIAASGGIESPLLPGSLLLVGASALFVGRRPALALTVGQVAFNFGALAVLGALGWLPADFFPRAFGTAHTGVWLAATLFLLGLMMTVLTLAGSAVRGLFDAMVLEAVEAREDALETWTAQNRELTALAAEIAHELKNPLSSVKGLSALMAADATGRDAERLAVLRGEVERMQGILEGFLNFSRPIVPVDASDVDLVALLGEIALLHEGTARDHAVTLRVEGRGITARCDARKLKQIAINLVQNALDAAPAGSTVTLAVGGADPVELTVRDHGPGVDPAVRARLFEPGVTTRPHGSGLGLVIARALARQHGGDLVLESADGTIARVTLPRRAA
jgi:two-component system sensor histidine kinase HydH